MYRTPAKVWEDLGGRSDPSIIEGVLKGHSKCVAMGPPWIHIHPQTELVEIVIIEFAWQETFETSWDQYTTATIENQPAAITDAGGGAGCAATLKGGSHKGAGKKKGKKDERGKQEKGKRERSWESRGRWNASTRFGQRR